MSYRFGARMGTLRPFCVAQRVATNYVWQTKIFFWGAGFLFFSNKYFFFLFFSRIFFTSHLQTYSVTHQFCNDHIHKHLSHAIFFTHFLKFGTCVFSDISIDYFPSPLLTSNLFYFGFFSQLGGDPSFCDPVSAPEKGIMYLPQEHSFPENLFDCNICMRFPFWGHFLLFIFMPFWKKNTSCESNNDNYMFSYW